MGLGSSSYIYRTDAAQTTPSLPAERVPSRKSRLALGMWSPTGQEALLSNLVRGMYASTASTCTSQHPYRLGHLAIVPWLCLVVLARNQIDEADWQTI